MNDSTLFVLDGGLGSALDALGCDTSSKLWSAALLTTEIGRQQIEHVHKMNYDSGANIIITATYQATYLGFRTYMNIHDDNEIDKLMIEAVNIAVRAKNAAAIHRKSMYIFASCGCYGAYLANGEEFTGDYGNNMTMEKLIEFHRRRAVILAKCEDVDVLAFETIPCTMEITAIITLMKNENELKNKPFYCSISCSNATKLRSGELIIDALNILFDAKLPNMIGVGVNCTSQEYISDIVTLIHSKKPDDNMHIICYPNSGEGWDDHTKSWIQDASRNTDDMWCSNVLEWYKNGANIIGGCCRINEKHIKLIHDALKIYLNNNNNKLLLR